jgi:hypothetical protein
LQVPVEREATTGSGPLLEPVMIERRSLLEISELFSSALIWHVLKNLA